MGMTKIGIRELQKGQEREKEGREEDGECIGECREEKGKGKN